jgi:hypothetical protein
MIPFLRGYHLFTSSTLFWGGTWPTATSCKSQPEQKGEGSLGQEPRHFAGAHWPVTASEHFFVSLLRDRRIFFPSLETGFLGFSEKQEILNRRFFYKQEEGQDFCFPSLETRNFFFLFRNRIFRFYL